MNSDRRITFIRYSLMLMNYAIVLYITFVIIHTTNIVCEDFKAYELLSSFTNVPIPPFSLILVTQFLILFFFALVIIRDKIEALPETFHLILISFDIAIALVLLYFLNVSNKGVLLLVIINITIYIKSRRNKNILLGLSVLLYIIIDFDMLSSTFHLYSFGDYLNYYDATTRIILFGLRNILYSLTLVLFILFMIFEIQVYLEESTRVKELNKSLFELTQRLRLSNVQLKEYSKRNEEMAKLKERNRLAREIHDSIGHYLTAIDMGVKSCLRAVDHDPSRLPDQLSKVNDLTKKSLVDVRRSIKELRPDALTRYSLISAIENLSSEISDLSRVKVRLEICGTEYKLKTHIEEFIYRIVQEGISNAIRHSKPSRIMIIVDYREASINIRITNDGLEAENIDPGFGLTHIKSKVEELSGTFRYSVNPDMEFIFEIDIPQARRTL